MSELGALKPSSGIWLALQEIVEKTLASHKFEISVAPASKSGANNFIGIVQRASFSKEGDVECKENLSHTLIVKIAPQQFERRERFSVRQLFLREIYVYENVLPVLRQFEQSRGASMNGFEDLNVRGFTMVDRCSEEVTASQVQLMMQILGKFHAISFALFDQGPQKFNELTCNLTELYVRRNDQRLRNYFDMMANSILNALSSDAHILVRLKLTEPFKEDAIDIAADCIDRSSTGRAAIITHGDKWQNNIMFLKNAKNGTPIEARLLDWQMARISSPVIDIVYYIFCCTTKELRDTHYEKFLKIYHDSFLGSNPDQLFPYDLMMEHFHKYGKFGLILASTLLPTITADRGREMNLDDMSTAPVHHSGKQPNFIDHPLISDSSRIRYDKRIREVAVDMFHLGYF